ERPAGMAGELWIGGASLALGYHNKPEMTEQRFVQLPQEGNARFYASGDLALWSDKGEILLLGRADDQVKIRGNRVELAEVACLLESCESVSQAAVLAVKDA
ncbi:AMP-binding protein, partial [Desulfovibrio desulfuricans]|uniref:AMP-binding protein n=1 Tax=Desulfovibrio desulfuricans TaxID=876 RepID=UPI0023B0284D